MATADTSTGHATHAERLRGKRFWLPLLACMAALVVGGIVWQSSLPPVAKPAPRQSLTHVDPGVAALIQRLQARRVFCGALKPAGPHGANCVFGAAASPTLIQVFPTHRAVLAQIATLERLGKASYAKGKVVTYVISGSRWILSGTWSRTGAYTANRTGDALAAQQLSTSLSGCLELVPREAGSCSF